MFHQDSSDIPSTVLSSSPSHGDQEVEEGEGEGEGEAAQVERQRQLEAANLFDAALHIHQAALTKDTTTEGWVRTRWDWPGACSHFTVCCATLSPALPLCMLWCIPTPWWSE